MATIEIDLTFFILEQIALFFVVPATAIGILYKAYKSPEFWLKLRKQEYVYVLMRTALGPLKIIVKPLSQIGANGEMLLFKNRKYFWQTKDKKGNPTTFPFKKKIGAIFDWNDPFPQVWVPGNSLNSMTDPAALDDIVDMKILKLMMNADKMTRLMRIALMLSVMSLLVVAVLAYAVVTSSADTTNGLDHIWRVLNGTRTGP